jgi:putative Holliday junction resolvase
MILGLDVGDVRIGVALANPIARLPRPLAVIANDETVLEKIAEIVRREKIEQVVVGLPRNLKGAETAQSKKVREFAAILQEKLGTTIEFADETLSSVRAEAMPPLNKRSSGQSLDAEAACFILEEFLANHPGKVS